MTDNIPTLPPRPLGTSSMTPPSIEIYKLRVLDALKNSDTPIEIHFQKVDGSIRKILATLNQSLITTQYEKKTDTVKVPNPDVQAVYDTEKNEWRSLRWNAIIEAKLP